MALSAVLWFSTLRLDEPQHSRWVALSMQPWLRLGNGPRTYVQYTSLKKCLDVCTVGTCWHLIFREYSTMPNVWAA